MKNTISNVATHTIQVIPLMEGDKLPAQLQKIARLTGIDNETLIADFKATKKEIFVIYPIKKTFTKVYLLGLGKPATMADSVAVARSFFYKNKKKLTDGFSINLAIGNTENLAEYLANGLYLAEYEIGFLKTKPLEEADCFSIETAIEWVCAANKTEKIQAEIEKGKAMANTQQHILRLMDSPANYKNPQKVADFALESGRNYGFDVKVFNEIQCEEIGLHALLAVGKGSVENPARFIVMEYKSPRAKPDSVIGLVGKGVTFDTGGISIKPSDGMSYMKSDMGGAAAVIGTIEMAAKLQLPVHIVGVVPSTENCVDGLATKPGDVISSYSGKTIEVIDTDAEGRLILADGLSYIKKNYNPLTIIDLATLTGSCIRALGYAAAGLLSNNDELADELYKVGLQTGEKVWRLPLWDDYRDMMNSDIADIKNLSVAPLAGAITAAKFLEEFIDKHPRWAHLDIAGTAFGDSEFGKMKSATAYGIRLLVEWIVKYN